MSDDRKAPFVVIDGGAGDDGSVPKDHSDEAVFIRRNDSPAPDPSEGRGVVALKRHDNAYKNKINQEALSDYCRDCFQHIVPDDPDRYAYGTALSNHVKLEIHKYWIAMMFSLSRVDDATANACKAALLATLATTIGPAELQTAKFAIAAFIHAHPKFAKITTKAPSPAPFGEDTDFTVFNMGFRGPKGEIPEK